MTSTKSLDPTSIKESNKEQIFTDLCNECRTLAPMALLSMLLRLRLERLRKDERREIVSKTQDGCAPLFVACKRGNVDVVEYLLNTCHAPIEQKGLYQVPDDRSIHLVTPLWCASVSGKYHVVKTLVQHGANVNSASDTGSTPVRSACFMNHYPIVVYLVNNGSDISLPNHNGGTCLINSVQSVNLCQFLLKLGADVNAQDIEHKTALHYAIQEHRENTTKLLLSHGADPFLKSLGNDDALQIACIRGSLPIFEYLIKNVKYTQERIACAYELLGSTFLDDHHDIQVALKYWKKAADIRAEHNIPKKVLPPRKMFHFITEFQSKEELFFIAADHNSIRSQSLLISERILGTSHRGMPLKLLYRGAAYADSFQYQQCIDLWLYAFELRIHSDTILSSDTTFTVQALARLYLDILEKHQAGVVKETVSFYDVLHTLKLITNEIPECINLLKIRPIHKQHQKHFDNMLKIIVNLLYVIFKLDCAKDQIYLVATIINSLLKKDPRTCTDNYTLLHMSVDKKNLLFTNQTNKDKVLNFPCVKVINFLLECGSDINAVSSIGWSPLYIASLPPSFNAKVISTLLSAGAHIDQITNAGLRPIQNMLLDSETQLLPMNYITLQCLAAQIIQNHKIHYKGVVPTHLNSFINMH